MYYKHCTPFTMDCINVGQCITVAIEVMAISADVNGQSNGLYNCRQTTV